jgi:hypothetical protein
MKLWQMQARTLPVTVRPIGGETVPSFARRLAEANDLSPTAVLRALGEYRNSGGHHVFERDACLNDQAVDRLTTYAAIPRTRLAKALPALTAGMPAHHTRPLPADRPTLHFYTPSPHPRPACRHCVLRRATTPNPTDALIRSPAHAPLLCHPHRRWLGTWPADAQYDLTHASEIFPAATRYQRLLTQDHDTDWIIAAFHQAWSITQNWGQHPPTRPLPVTVTRWRTRAAELGIPGQLHQPIVTFPEAVTLTEVLTDLGWRRHLALADLWQINPFYEHTARRLGEPLHQRKPDFYWPTWGQQDALTRWVHSHRLRFTAIRRHHQTEQKRHWYPQPLPEKGHFK